MSEVEVFAVLMLSAVAVGALLVRACTCTLCRRRRERRATSRAYPRARTVRR